MLGGGSESYQMISWDAVSNHLIDIDRREELCGGGLRLNIKETGFLTCHAECEGRGRQTVSSSRQNILFFADEI
jgi:hypothetical protein